MAIRDNFPTASPSLLIDFVNSKSLDPRIAYSRTSAGTYIGRDGLLKNAAASEPRFEYDLNSRCLGLLIEGTAVNLVNASAGDSGYNISGTNPPTATNTDGPDGVTAACRYDCTSSNNAFITIVSSSTLTSGLTYTVSLFVRADQTMLNNNLAVVVQSGAQNIYTGQRTITTSWTRIEHTFTVIETTSNWRLQLFFGGQSDGRIIDVWGAQVEEKPRATSYIRRTANQQATRNNDICEMIIDSTIYNQTRGTVITRARTNTTPRLAAENRTFSAFNSSTNGGSIWNVWWESGPNVLASLYQSPSNTYVAALSSTVTATNNTTYTISTSYALNDFKVAANGVVGQTDTSGAVPTSIDKIMFGHFGSFHHLDGHVQKLIYYPFNLSSSQLQTLSRG